MLYFAYGSNLDEQNWAEWCASTDHDPSSIEPIGPAWLPDHEVVFHYRSRLRHGGALDVCPRLGAATPGALFRVNDWAALDAKEGAAGGYYERVSAVVLTEDGHAHDAYTYRVCESRIVSHVAPSEAYLQLCVRGLSRFRHSDAHLDAAARGEPVPQVVNDVFVYGSLMHEKSANHLMQGHQALERAHIEGMQLVRIDWYPGIVPGNATVRGEKYFYESTQPVLHTLDEYEDFAGYGRADSLYRRSLVRAHAPGGSALCWTYVYLGEVDASCFIDSGDWEPSRRGGT